MAELLRAEQVRALRTQMAMSEMDFALMLGVTVRAVQLWEAGIVLPSRLTSMVIQATAAKHAQQRQERTLGLRVSRAARPRPASTKRVRGHV